MRLTINLTPSGHKKHVKGEVETRKNEHKKQVKGEVETRKN